MPSAAARAATAFARFPVEVQDSVSSPNSFAFAAATATTRSLNECVGFGNVELEVDLAHPDGSSEPRRGNERREAGRGRVFRQPRDRQQIHVAPQRARPRLDPLPRHDPAQLVPVVHGFERTEAANADTVCEGGVVTLADPATEDVNGHGSTSFSYSDAVSANTRSPSLRFCDRRPAEAGAAARGSRRDRPRLRQPGHSLARARGREARRGRPEARSTTATPRAAVCRTSARPCASATGTSSASRSTRTCTW